MFRFENMAAFNFLFLLPVIIGLFWYLTYHGQKKIREKYGDKIYPFLSASVSINRRRWKLILESFVLILFVFALARPQMGKSQDKIRSEGVEMMLLLDVSTSMLAEDVRPNRLDFLKNEMSRLLDKLSGDKVGIIAFAGSALLMSPLTNDHTALKMFIDSLTHESVSTQGTEFIKALDEAQEALVRGGVEEDEVTNATKVVLIASDGEDHQPGAVKKAQELAKKGIRIFSIAFGTEKGAPIPIRDEDGNLLAYKKDRKGKVILSQVKGTFLRELAVAGKGSFYQASFGGGETTKIVEEISKLEKAEFESETAYKFDERYQLILLLGILLGLIELILAERRKDGRIWKGRFEVMQS